MTTLAAAIVQNPPDALAALTALLAALGLSSTAGLRAYLPLLAVAVASNSSLLGPNQPPIIPLQGNFQDLNSGVVIAILVVLVIGEFVVDKIPIVDHVSDAIHTVIRPLSGAIIMAGTANTISNINPWVAAVIGALLALGVHGVKAASRPAVTATTAGVGNPVVSVIEDVLAVVAVVLLVLVPVVGFILLVILVFVIGRLLFGVVRRFRRKKTGGAVLASNNGNGRGRGRSKKAGINVAPAAAIGAAPGAVANALPAPVSPVAPALATPVLPVTPTTPTLPPTPSGTTVAATYQPAFSPAPQTPSSNPIFPAAPAGGPLAPTQAYNPQQGGAYPTSSDAPTLPGSN